MTEKQEAMLARGRSALEVGDWSRARDSFTAALDLKETAEALNGLGEALWWLGETHESVDLRERAYAEFRRRPDPMQAATIALGLCVHYQANVGNPAASAGWLARAKRLVNECELADFRGWILLLEAGEAENPALGEKLAGEAASLLPALATSIWSFAHSLRWAVVGSSRGGWKRAFPFWINYGCPLPLQGLRRGCWGSRSRSTSGGHALGRSGNVQEGRTHLEIALAEFVRLGMPLKRRALT